MKTGRPKSIVKGQKTCTACSVRKTLKYFVRSGAVNKDGSSRYLSWCKSCRSKYQKAHPLPIAQKKHYELKYNYGITLSDFKRMNQEQKGKCKICQKKGAIKKGIGVDHDHRTGNVRGLLCDKCNRGLGLFQDNAVIIDRASAYLKSHGKI